MANRFQRACIALAGFITALAAAPALAQQDGSGGTATPAMTAEQQLDVWLRAQALDQRCAVLNYFETRLVSEGVSNALQQTAAGREAASKAGQAGFEAALEKSRQLLSARSEAARQATATAPCSPDQPDIMMVRQTYFRSIFKALLASQNAIARANDTEARQRAASELGALVRALYGDSTDPLGQALVEELYAEMPDVEEVWTNMRPLIDNTSWQLRLQEAGVRPVHQPGAPGYYRLEPTSDTATGVPATFSHLIWPKVWGEDGSKVRVLQLQGLTDDGRVIVLITRTGERAGPDALKAQLLVQEPPGLIAWSYLDWRETTLRFDAGPLEGAPCPTDFCFVFPLEASAALRARRGDAAPDYAVELYIAPPSAFPPPAKSATSRRDRFYPVMVDADWGP